MFVDFPLGHTAGKRGDKALQRRIMIDTLSALDGLQQPGTIRPLPYRWSPSDDWKNTVMRPKPSKGHVDDRIERSDAPQYQYAADREAAKGRLDRS